MLLYAKEQAPLNQSPKMIVLQLTCCAPASYDFFSPHDTHAAHDPSTNQRVVCALSCAHDSMYFCAALTSHGITLFSEGQPRTSLASLEIRQGCTAAACCIPTPPHAPPHPRPRLQPHPSRVSQLLRTGARPRSPKTCCGCMGSLCTQPASPPWSRMGTSQT